MFVQCVYDEKESFYNIRHLDAIEAWRRLVKVNVNAGDVRRRFIKLDAGDDGGRLIELDVVDVRRLSSGTVFRVVFVAPPTLAIASVSASVVGAVVASFSAASVPVTIAVSVRVPVSISVTIGVPVSVSSRLKNILVEELLLLPIMACIIKILRSK
jgi:hypothetical protein